MCWCFSSFLSTLIRCYWAASLGISRTDEQLLWVVSASGETLPPCHEHGGRPGQCHLPAQLCWAGRFLWGAQAGCTSRAYEKPQGLEACFNFYSISDKSVCLKKYAYGLNRKVYTWKVLWIHAQVAAEMTPGQTPVFGRKFRLLCWYLFLSF